MVETNVLLESTCTDGIEKAESTEAINVTGIFCHLERDLDVRLSTEVVDLSRLDLGDNVHEVGAVAQITIMKLELIGPWWSLISDWEFARSDGIRVRTHSHAGRHTCAAICWC